MEEDQRYDSINSETSSKDELDPSELKTFLDSLAGQEPLKETAMRRLLRRFSANYHNAPKVFTEGLLMRIEESVINNNASQYPEDSRRILKIPKISFQEQKHKEIFVRDQI